MDFNKKKICNKADEIIDVLNDEESNMTAGEMMSAIALVASKIVAAVADSEKQRDEAVHVICECIKAAYESE